MAVKSERKILGVRLESSTIRAIKSEAARRGVTVATVIDDAWKKYQDSGRRS